MRLGFQRGAGGCSRFFRAVGALGILLMALLIWLSADPRAHEYFHRGARHEDHACVVTDFALGEAFYLAPIAVIPPEPVEYRSVGKWAIETPRSAVAYRLLPSCGPPA